MPKTLQATGNAQGMFSGVLMGFKHWIRYNYVLVR